MKHSTIIISTRKDSRHGRAGFGASDMQRLPAEGNIRYRRTLPGVLLMFMCAVVASVSLPTCTSPLDIDTPRDRIVEGDSEWRALTQGNRVSVAFAFDASASMMGEGNAAAISGALNLVQYLDGSDDQGAVLWFSQDVILSKSMTSRKDSLVSAVSALPTSGVTALWDGTYDAVAHVSDRGSNTVRSVVVFTDGVDNASVFGPREVLALASARRISVFFVGYGDQVSAPELRAVADSTRGSFQQISSRIQADSAYLRILKTLRKMK
jgi:Mg-chelatase subunit ChlD